MKKLTIKFTGEVILAVEDGEEIADVFAELELTHPDVTRVADYTLEGWELVDCR